MLAKPCSKEDQLVYNKTAEECVKKWQKPSEDPNDDDLKTLVPLRHMNTRQHFHMLLRER